MGSTWMSVCLFKWVLSGWMRSTLTAIIFHHAPLPYYRSRRRRRRRFISLCHHPLSLSLFCVDNNNVLYCDVIL